MIDRARWVSAGLLLVLLTAFVSGVSTFVNVYAVAGTSSDAFVTVRNLAVAAAFLPVGLLVARSRGVRSLRSSDWGRLVLVGLLGGSVPFLLFFHGLALASAAGGATTAAFGYRTLFLFASVFGLVYLRERLHGRLLVGAALLLIGNVLLLGLTSAVLTDGTAYVLAATVLWAAEYTVSKRLLSDLPSATVALGRMGFGAAFLAAYLTATTQWSAVAALSGPQWAWVGISAALLGAFVATWYPGLKRVGVSDATAVLVLGFPVTWILGVLLHGVPLSLAQALGAVAVVAGAGVAVGVAKLTDAARYVRRLLRPEARPA